MSRAGRDFESHIATCEQCKQFIPEKTARLALICLEGSRLFKSMAQSARQELARELEREP